MTRPATLPELLAKGKVKPGDWVECVTTFDPNECLYRPGRKYLVEVDGSDVCFHGEEDFGRCSGSEGTFIPVKPAKAKKWGDWFLIDDPRTYTVACAMATKDGMEVKRTKKGLKARYLCNNS